MSLQNAIHSLCETIKENYGKKEIIDDFYDCISREADAFCDWETTLEEKKKIIEEYGGIYKALKDFGVEALDTENEEIFVSRLTFNILYDALNGFYDDIVEFYDDIVESDEENGKPPI